MISPTTHSCKFTFAAAVFVAAMAANAPVQADSTTIAAMNIDGLYQKDGNGLYDQIVAAAAQNAGLIVTIDVLAPNRAFKEFESGKVACVSPANTNPDFYNFSFATVESASMTTAKVYIFTKAGSAPIANLADLKGKKVGYRAGMPYGKKVENAGLKLVKAKTDEANVKKLQAGRIDAFLAYTPDMYALFENLGMKPLPHAADNPVAVHEDTLLCRKDMGGEEIVANFNAGYKKIEASGALGKILGE